MTGISAVFEEEGAGALLAIAGATFEVVVF